MPLGDLVYHPLGCKLSSLTSLTMLPPVFNLNSISPDLISPHVFQVAPLVQLSLETISNYSTLREAPGIFCNDSQKSRESSLREDMELSICSGGVNVTQQLDSSDLLAFLGRSTVRVRKGPRAPERSRLHVHREPNAKGHQKSQLLKYRSHAPQDDQKCPNMQEARKDIRKASEV